MKMIIILQKLGIQLKKNKNICLKIFFFFYSTNVKEEGILLVIFK